MSDWKAKRFWTHVGVEKDGQGYVVTLDKRRVQTPAKRALVLPSRRLAERIAQEWDAQDEQIVPLSMPFTRAANSAIDRVTPHRAEVAALIADYGASDLVCYRADSPDELVARQAAAWDPILDWLAATFEVRLVTTAGLQFVAQPDAAIQILRAEVDRMTPFQLTALHDLVGLSGSLAIGLAATRDAFDIDTLWAASRIDESWQIAQWGADDEAEALARSKHADFLRAHELFNMI